MPLDGTAASATSGARRSPRAAPTASGRPLLRAASRRAAPALRLPPRARRRAEELGRAQGAEPRSRGEAPRGARRGPSARVRRLRGHHPGGRVRRRRGDPVGPWALGADRRPRGGLPARQAQVHAARQEAARRLDAGAHGRPGRGGRQELAAAEGARRRGAPATRESDRRRATGERRRSTPDGRCPSACAPQLATLADAPPRATTGCTRSSTTATASLCRLEDGRVQLFTRNGQDWTARLGPVARGVRRAAGAHGLARRRGRRARGRRSHPLRGAPGGACRTAANGVRCATSSSTCCTSTAPICAGCRSSGASSGSPRCCGARASDTLRYGDHVVGRGAAFLRQACAHGLEGIVSKRRDAPYRDGRGADWQKVRCGQRGEFVVGGFTDPGGTRAGLGALLLGAYESPGRLGYVGRVGTGFDEKTLRDLHRGWSRASSRTRRSCPSPTCRPARTGCGRTWSPRSRFTNWTRDGRLRHPVFLGLREDKPAAEVVREMARRRRDVATASPRWKACASPIRTACCGPRPASPSSSWRATTSAVADWILPHVAGRPLALVRAPRGHTGTTFFQKHVARGMPDAVRGVTITGDDGRASTCGSTRWRGWSGSCRWTCSSCTPGERAPTRSSVPTGWCSTSIPTRASRGPASWRPRARRACAWSTSGSTCVVKTTGGKGLHVVVPLAPPPGVGRREGVRARPRRRPGAPPAGRLHGEPGEGGAPRQDLPRLSAQRPRRDGDRGVLDARPPRCDRCRRRSRGRSSTPASRRAPSRCARCRSVWRGCATTRGGR